MSASFLDDDRIVDLLVTRTVEGLDEREEAELRGLSGNAPGFDAEAIDRVAAALSLNQLVPEEMPGELRRQVAREAHVWLDGRKGANVLPFPQPGVAPAEAASAPVVDSGGPSPAWWAAAAGLAVAAFGLWQAENTGREMDRLAAELESARAESAAVAEAVAERDLPVASVSPTPESLPTGELRARLLEQPETGLWGWSATEDPVAAAASGDVVWNGSEQTGYMRFVGLEPNATDSATYQLWIFDEARDERFPVDGGVFDIPPGSTEVIVPIRPTLGVTRPVLFAVTVEPPGGVMVSSRERIALVAKPGA